MAEEQKVPGEDQVVTDGKIFAVIGYIGILCLLPLLLKKDNKFALHHGKQGLVIFIAGIIASVIVMIPVIGLLVFFVAMPVLAIFAIIGIIQALSGKYWRAPLIADLADKINL